MQNATRRIFLWSGFGVAAASLLPRPAFAGGARPGARMRVIIDNDFSGDPDGLCQLVHHLLSPSVDIRLIVGSHLSPTDPFDPSPMQAANAAAKANAVIGMIPGGVSPRVVAGRETAIRQSGKHNGSAAVDAIIAEAMRDDSSLPLYYCAGAGLTELATAWTKEPRIGKKLTLVWIGGPEYPDLVPKAEMLAGVEYNTKIDIEAVRVIFNRSDIPIWQVPRNAYRKMLVSSSELHVFVRNSGKVGRYLAEAIDDIAELALRFKLNTGETYVLGDSPLVTLTALQSSFEPDASSSRYLDRPAPIIDEHGAYIANPDGRTIRIYTDIDQRLTFSDFFAKLKLLAERAP